MPRMPRRPRPDPVDEHLQLANGRRLWLRAITPADAGPLRAGFPLLRPDEVRQRFLHALTELTPAMAHHLTHLDPARALAVVAAEPLPPGEALVGAVVRVALDDDDPTRAEFAILVSHFIAGMGVGRRLMDHMLAWARVRGMRRVHGDVLEHNAAMLRLAASLGFRRERHPNDPGLVRVVLQLSAARRRRRG